MSVYTSISKFHDTYVDQMTLFQKYMHRLMHVKNPYFDKERGVACTWVTGTRQSKKNVA